jgi:hypothetical protein
MFLFYRSLIPLALEAAEGNKAINSRGGMLLGFHCKCCTFATSSRTLVSHTKRGLKCTRKTQRHSVESEGDIHAVLRVTYLWVGGTHELSSWPCLLKELQSERQHQKMALRASAQKYVRATSSFVVSSLDSRNAFMAIPINSVDARTHN